MWKTRDWVSLAAASFCVFAVTGINRVNGIFYLEFLDLFNRGPFITSWIQGAPALGAMAAGPISGYLSDRVSPKTAFIIVGVTQAGYLAASSVARNMETIIALAGCIRGTTGAFGLVATLTFVNKKFEDRRQRANASLYIGTSVLNIVSPVVIQAWVDMYSVRGALLLFGAFLFNTCVCGMLVDDRSSRSTRKPSNKTVLQIQQTVGMAEMEERDIEAAVSNVQQTIPKPETGCKDNETSVSNVQQTITQPETECTDNKNQESHVLETITKPETECTDNETPVSHVQQTITKPETECTDNKNQESHVLQPITKPEAECKDNETPVSHVQQTITKPEAECKDNETPVIHVQQTITKPETGCKDNETPVPRVQQTMDKSQEEGKEYEKPVPQIQQIIELPEPECTENDTAMNKVQKPTHQPESACQDNDMGMTEEQQTIFTSEAACKDNEVQIGTQIMVELNLDSNETAAAHKQRSLYLKEIKYKETKEDTLLESHDKIEYKASMCDRPDLKEKDILCETKIEIDGTSPCKDNLMKSQRAQVVKTESTNVTIPSTSKSFSDVREPTNKGLGDNNNSEQVEGMKLKDGQRDYEQQSYQDKVETKLMNGHSNGKILQTEVFKETTEEKRKGKCGKICSIWNRKYITAMIWFAGNKLAFLCIIQFIPAYAEEIGMPEFERSLLISISSGGEVLMRLFLAIFGDSKWVNKEAFISAAAIIASVTTILLPMFPTPMFVFVYMGVYGLISDAMTLYMGSLVVESVGVENLGVGLGNLPFCFGLAAVIAPALCGYLREVTGTYKHTMTVASLSSLLSLVSFSVFGGRISCSGLKPKASSVYVVNG